MMRTFAKSMLVAVLLTQGCGDRSGHTPSTGTADTDVFLDQLVAPKTVDLGDVLPGEEVPYKFIVKNASTTQPVLIQDVSTSCGCTTTSPGPIDIPPGAEATIKGVFDVSESVLTEYATSLVWVGAKRDVRHTIKLRAKIIQPLPESISPSGRQPFIVPLDQRYHGHVQSAAVYDGDSDVPLPGGLTQDESGIEIGSSLDSVEILHVVLKIKRPGLSAFKIVTDVRVIQPTGL